MRGVAGLISLALVASAAGVGAITVAAITTTTSANAAGGSTILGEDFSGATVSDSRWIGLGDSCLTASTSTGSGTALGKCSKTTDTAYLAGETPGFLQLTDNSGGSTGNVLFDRALPTSAGLDVSFYQYQFATSSTGAGFGAADGIGFFLTDGAYSLSSPGPTGGSYGGALGYATIRDSGGDTNPSKDGVAHGVLGLGLDVFGHYSEQPYVGGNDCSSTHAQTANAVALRGDGDGKTGYCLLSSKQLTSSDPQILNTTVPTAATSGQDNGTLVHVVISVPNSDGYATVTVSLNDAQVSSTTLTYKLPSTVKLGFSASTGGGHSVHLVRAVTVKSVEPLGAVDLVKSIDHTDTTGTTKTTFTTGDTIPYSFEVTNTGSETLTNILVADPKVANISCPATSLEPATSMTCTGTYSSVKEAEAAAGKVDNTATVTGTAGGETVTDESSATASTYTTANFSVTKELTGTGASLADSDTNYSVNYSYPAGSYKYCAVDGTATASDTTDTYAAGSGTLAVKAGHTVSSGRIPTGATVTLSETTPSAVAGATWGSSTLSSSTVTIGCATTTQAVTVTNTLLRDQPSLAITKAANTTTLPADGGVVNYTVTVTNPGPGNWTVDNPATASDDLSGVLDDAAYNGDVSASTGAVSVSGSTLSWSGALAAGASATVTYSVTYNANKPGGDHVLENTASVPADSVTGDTPPTATVVVPAGAYTVSKSVDPSSGTSVEAGQTLTYTLTYISTGEASATVDTTDDLTGVLDDATITEEPTVSNPNLTATRSGTTLTVMGTLPVGATYTVAYQVKVNAYNSQGDHDLKNTVTTDNGGGIPTGGGYTENPVAHVSVEKAAVSSAEPVYAGGTVTYTVTATNDGGLAYTTSSPASVTDDLSGVLDDATLTAGPTATAGAAEVSGTTLTWSGPLAVGDSVTITYTVTVTDKGDSELTNTATWSDCPATDTTCTGVTDTKLPKIVVSKSVDPSSGTAVYAGDTLAYTLTWTNEGTAAGVVDSTDDLTGVLDDATLTSGPTSSSAAATAVVEGSSIRTTGTLGAGETVTVTYTVTVNASSTGDNIVANTLTPDNPSECTVDATTGTCDGTTPPSTVNNVGRLATWKTVDPGSTSTVQAGQVLTYTLHFENTGEASVDVSKVDNLSALLDDATVTTKPVATDGLLTVSTIANKQFSVTGSLEAGQVETVTYQVTVNADGKRGDDLLANWLLDPGQPVPDDPADCVASDTADCTVNPVSGLVVTKTADPASGASVKSGQTVTYTIAFKNLSTTSTASAQSVAWTDDLAGVLDDATLNTGTVTASTGLTAKVDGSRLNVTGLVASGVTATVTYTITVKAYRDQGDHSLVNYVFETGKSGTCVTDSGLCTKNPVSNDLADTTATSIAETAGIAALLLCSGLLLVAVARRRRVNRR